MTTTALEHPSTRTHRQPPTRITGVLEIAQGGQGHLRTGGCLPTPSDPQVPAALIRRYGLRKGDTVEGVRDGRHALTDIERINGRTPEALRGRPHFGDLTPLHPRERLRLEHPASGLAGRLVDLVAPVGKGQRGLIVAPPKTGKTVLLQQLAAAIAANHPTAHLMVVLLDERPEEVTDMRRSVRGEVYASTFDQSPKQHIALAELVVERAKRLVEQGEDVVILLDSLTRLCRAHNNAAASGGRTLSGGVDAAALHGPKRLFGAARLTEEAGSLTILATALVETGSRADDFFFEELKGTGNMELRLDRALADRRVFPALDITPSGTRREELLLTAGELTAVRGLRRALRSREGQANLETLLQRMRATPDNATFLRQVQPTLPVA
ncbi:transcription termination factor Rho [Streptomyces ipomoeae]|uniref:Transcription termination factor Rho n=2 Tax=Streptomyces ipomoeae TaxID=103232 RepID=L1L268_9ACTN|nr:transcription termination factor Rho [Streptomyces ipomoeae]EKX67171.1 putative transcription termination factor Rho [Streptomyces ipomoeae 91-03]MDX2696146.1 transcription termination factor Rho [Streptomyces ipomoeae]MDX2841887.1 transcription termination factor Rho [Streptomyces ipomoeae]TQE28136.1 transcription termination factor Rho [Streptomyces ipomoeae]TQE30327.1 transcription termination factor Rho [Streptomyces ipomoeae]